MERKIDEVCLMCSQIRIMFKKVEKGFRIHSKKLLKDADKLGKDIDVGCIQLMESLIISAEKVLIPLPSDFERIGDSLESIIYSVSTKIKDRIMFSDKAVKEIESLFEGADELLECLHDCLKTKNRILINHIIERSKELIELADKYSCMHQERLVGELCPPKASFIYLDIIDSLRNVAIHICIMAERLKEEGLQKYCKNLVCK
jgi:Na+/phosphate symporter